MTEAAYFLSKRAEHALVGPLLKLLEREGFVPEAVQISSPLEASPWDIAIITSSGTIFVDIKLAAKARLWGRIAPQTLADIKASLERGVDVLLFVPPKVYLLNDLRHLPDELSLDFLEENTPSLLVDPETRNLVKGIYEAMLVS